MNKKVNEMARKYDEANEAMSEAQKHVSYDSRHRMSGDVDALCRASDRLLKAIADLRDAVGIRAMCGFIKEDDGTKSAVEFFKDFPAK